MKKLATAAMLGMLVSQASVVPTMAQTASPAVTPATQSAATFANVAPSAKLTSEIIGLAVFNNANESIGTIKDIAYVGEDVKAYILAVGGIMGLGDRYVAVEPSSISVSYDTNSKKWHANMNATSDQLKAAPAFNYPAKS